MKGLHSIVYCSRSRVGGTPAQRDAEIRNILARSRTNNATAGLSGALLYSSSLFAQVLEGPADDLARVFERIQRDERHCEVAVLSYEPVPARAFPSWAMAYVAPGGDDGDPALHPELDAIFASRSAGSGQRVLEMLRRLVRDDVLASIT